MDGGGQILPKITANKAVRKNNNMILIMTISFFNLSLKTINAIYDSNKISKFIRI